MAKEEAVSRSRAEATGAPSTPGGAGSGLGSGGGGSGLSRSIRALFEEPPADRAGEEPPSGAARGRGPRDRLTTLSARYLRGDRETRERLAPAIEAQARLLLASGEAEVVADAVVAIARVEHVHAPEGFGSGDGSPLLATRLVDPAVERILEARLERSPDPAVHSALKRGTPVHETVQPSSNTP